MWPWVALHQTIHHNDIHELQDNFGDITDLFLNFAQFSSVPPDLDLLVTVDAAEKFHCSTWEEASSVACSEHFGSATRDVILHGKRVG
jgi:hypothetical protein